MKAKTKISKRTSCLFHTLSREKQAEAKLTAQNAILQNKIFMIQGPYSSVRSCLRERGWVEKFYYFSDNNETDIVKTEEAEDLDYNDSICQAPWKEEDGLYAYMHRLVMHKEPNLLWGIRKDVFNDQIKYDHQILNHFSNSTFTTKVGLNSHLQESHWYEQEYSHSFYPRVYQLVKVEEKLTFQADFIQTACVSLLKIINSNNADNLVNSDTENLPEIIIPDEIFTQALEMCLHQISFLTNNDIDVKFNDGINQQDFKKLLTCYYSVRRYKGRVSINHLESHSSQVASVLEQLEALCPQYNIDGIKNVWILKPGAKSRGRGVICLDNLDPILELVQSQVVTNEKKYVLQKYIETPLLIYDTKFDIRQWFLVTNWNPLTIWLYKQSYLRFCSQRYSLDDLEPSIHLTNNSIQKNCQNQHDRSPNLPDNNMWTCEQLTNYLEETHLECGYPEGEGQRLWRDVIYQGMKSAILSAMLCCQDDVEHRKNSFELYGADFMLDNNHLPWLIEINSSPCMTPSTQVTALLCPMVLQDTFKVVLDYNQDKSSDVGAFELIYKQNVVMTPNQIGLCMQVQGKSVSRSEFLQRFPWKETKKDKMLAFRRWNHITQKTITSAAKNVAKTSLVRKKSEKKKPRIKNGFSFRSVASLPLLPNVTRRGDENKNEQKLHGMVGSKLTISKIFKNAAKHDDTSERMNRGDMSANHASQNAKVSKKRKQLSFSKSGKTKVQGRLGASGRKKTVKKTDCKSALGSHVKKIDLSLKLSRPKSKDLRQGTHEDSNILQTTHKPDNDKPLCLVSQIEPHLSTNGLRDQKSKNKPTGNWTVFPHQRSPSVLTSSPRSFSISNSTPNQTISRSKKITEKTLYRASTAKTRQTLTTSSIYLTGKKTLFANH